MTSPMPDQSTMADRIAGFLDQYRLLDGDEKGEAAGPAPCRFWCGC